MKTPEVDLKGRRKEEPYTPSPEVQDYFKYKKKRTGENSSRIIDRLLYDKNIQEVDDEEPIPNPTNKQQSNTFTYTHLQGNPTHSETNTKLRKKSLSSINKKKFPNPDQLGYAKIAKGNKTIYQTTVPRDSQEAKPARMEIVGPLTHRAAIQNKLHREFGWPLEILNTFTDSEIAKLNIQGRPQSSGVLYNEILDGPVYRKRIPEYRIAKFEKEIMEAQSIIEKNNKRIEEIDKILALQENKDRDLITNPS